MSKNIFISCCFLMLFLSKNSFADIVRSTTFDDRLACEKSRGSWRDFGNSCVDKCSFKFDQYAVCAYAITFGCDCGKNRCLYEDKCISIAEYKKIYDENTLKDKDVVEDFKKKRKARAKKFENEYLNKLAGIYGADPNYRDPNRNYEEKKELPENTFKGTNRTLIYNHILKKHNDKILAQQKLNNQNNENNKLLIKPIEVVNNNKVEEVKIDNNLTKNAPIVLQPIEEEKPIDESPPKQNNNESFLRKFSKTPQDIFDEANKIIQNNEEKQNIENKNNNMNIPPVYVKQQNGENDFKNGDVINNIDNIPQFTN